MKTSRSSRSRFYFILELKVSCFYFNIVAREKKRKKFMHEKCKHYCVKNPRSKPTKGSLCSRNGFGFIIYQRNHHAIEVIYQRHKPVNLTPSCLIARRLSMSIWYMIQVRILESIRGTKPRDNNQKKKGKKKEGVGVGVDL